MQNLYCLHQETLSVFCSENNVREFLYIPAGTVISVCSQGGDGKFAEVIWDNKVVLMFSEDIQERAEPLYEPVASLPDASKRIHY